MLPRLDDGDSRAPEVASGSPVAAFEVDRHDRIVSWNQEAQDLLGFEPADALGRYCFGLICGRDPFGNRYCAPECPIVHALAQGDVIEPFLLSTTTKHGATMRLRVRARALPSPGPAFTNLLHLVEPGTGEILEALERRLQNSTLQEAAPSRRHRVVSTSPPLTAREHEILAQLACGRSALAIAARFDLSPATVRHHVHNILRKMEVRGQVEAVAVAFRRGWIPPI